MAAPIVVVLNREYAEQVWRHLRGEVYLDDDVDRLLGAMEAAAVVKLDDQRTVQADLFGGG